MDFDRRKYLLSRLSQLPLDELEDVVQGCQSLNSESSFVLGFGKKKSPIDDLKVLSRRAEHAIINNDPSELKKLVQAMSKLPESWYSLRELFGYAREKGSSQMKDYLGNLLHERGITTLPSRELFTSREIYPY